MDRHVKTVIACLVLATGIGMAGLFRRPPVGPAPSARDEGDPITYRKPGSTDLAGPSAPDPVTAAVEPPMAAPRRSARRVAPFNPGEPPPDLARSFPRSGPETKRVPPACSVPARSGAFDRPAAGAGRVHKIVDGDTLAGLAARYLGSADRHRDLYEMNRDLLPSPTVLPIGAELRIPGSPGGPGSESRVRRRPLVRIPPTPDRRRNHGR
ncbi:MAG: LysM peptidoglycan-binding domain-containing protein [Planctomycetota bacterium]